MKFVSIADPRAGKAEMLLRNMAAWEADYLGNEAAVFAYGVQGNAEKVAEHQANMEAIEAVHAAAVAEIESYGLKVPFQSSDDPDEDEAIKDEIARSA